MGAATLEVRVAAAALALGAVAVLLVSSVEHSTNYDTAEVVQEASAAKCKCNGAKDPELPPDDSGQFCGNEGGRPWCWVDQSCKNKILRKGGKGSTKYFSHSPCEAQAVAVETGKWVDKFTKSAKGCQCFWLKAFPFVGSKPTCACCAPGACQSGPKQPAKCEKCTGSKSRVKMYNHHPVLTATDAKKKAYASALKNATNATKAVAAPKTKKKKVISKPLKKKAKKKATKKKATKKVKQVDKYTVSLTGCKAPWNKKPAACCAKGGCLIPTGKRCVACEVASLASKLKPIAKTLVKLKSNCVNTAVFSGFVGSQVEGMSTKALFALKSFVLGMASEDVDEHRCLARYQLLMPRLQAKFKKGGLSWYLLEHIANAMNNNGGVLTVQAIATSTKTHSYLVLNGKVLGLTKPAGVLSRIRIRLAVVLKALVKKGVIKADEVHTRAAAMIHNADKKTQRFVTRMTHALEQACAVRTDCGGIYKAMDAYAGKGRGSGSGAMAVRSRGMHAKVPKKVKPKKKMKSAYKGAKPGDKLVPVGRPRMLKKQAKKKGAAKAKAAAKKSSKAVKATVKKAKAAKATASKDKAKKKAAAAALFASMMAEEDAKIAKVQKVDAQAEAIVQEDYDVGDQAKARKEQDEEMPTMELATLSLPTHYYNQEAGN